MLRPRLRHQDVWEIGRVVSGAALSPRHHSSVYLTASMCGRRQRAVIFEWSMRPALSSRLLVVLYPGDEHLKTLGISIQRLTVCGSSIKGLL
ncbi:hypothetical protein RRG08_012359 [Elysia crispata]|uniref:Uncharacterized protein n=1 Tax=Elysia crispata TaxID=231223 RepID=A0AAE1ABM1_9GAST|nr:hypothetical protein RRG08_012359 [Elysia crispata]